MFSRRVAAPNQNGPPVHALPRPVTIGFIPIQPVAPAVCTPWRVGVFMWNVLKILLALGWVASGLYVLSDTWRSGQSTGFHSFSATDAWISLFVLLSVTSGGATLVANAALTSCCQLDPEHSQQVVLEVECGLAGGLALFGGSVIWAKNPTSAYTSMLIYKWAIAAFAFSCFFFFYTLAPLLLVLRRHGTLYRKTWVSAANREPIHRPINVDKASDYLDGHAPRSSAYTRADEEARHAHHSAWADDSKSSGSSSAESVDASFYRAFSSGPRSGDEWDGDAQGTGGGHWASGAAAEEGQGGNGGMMDAVTQPFSWLGGAVLAGVGGRSGSMIIGQPDRALPAPPLLAPRSLPTVSGVPVYSGVVGATQRFNEKAQALTTPAVSAL